MDSYEEMSPANTIMVLTELDKSAKIAGEYALTLSRGIERQCIIIQYLSAPGFSF